MRHLSRHISFPLAIAEDIFGSFVDHKELECWVLVYPNGSRCDLYIDDEPMIDNFTANRPASDPAFWNGLVEILRRTSSVFFGGIAGR